MFSQCDIYNSLVVNIDSINCCYQLDEFKDEYAYNDTVRYMNLYYQLICEETLDSKKYNQLIDSFYILDKKFSYSGTKSDSWKFKSKQRKAIQLAKRRILRQGYNRSLDNEDFLRASDYAEKMKNCFPYLGDWQMKKMWEVLELSNYEKYAHNNVVKLIDYHSNWLFRDTTQMIMRNPPFDGYNDLSKTISSQYGKQEFKNVLEKSINNSRLKKEISRGRPAYKLEFEIENNLFDLYDREISILYYPDTILMDTIMTWNCYGENASIDAIVKVIPDTIQQKISNPSDLEIYKDRFRRTLLFHMIDKMDD